MFINYILSELSSFMEENISYFSLTMSELEIGVSKVFLWSNTISTGLSLLGVIITTDVPRLPSSAVMKKSGETLKSLYSFTLMADASSLFVLVNESSSIFDVQICSYLYYKFLGVSLVEPKI